MVAQSRRSRSEATDSADDRGAAQRVPATRQGEQCRVPGGGLPAWPSRAVRGHGDQRAQGESVPNYVNVEAISFTQTDIDKWYKPDFSDDLWVDVVDVLPEPELVRLGLKR